MAEAARKVLREALMKNTENKSSTFHKKQKKYDESEFKGLTTDFRGQPLMKRTPQMKGVLDVDGIEPSFKVVKRETTTEDQIKFLVLSKKMRASLAEYF